MELKYFIAIVVTISCALYISHKKIPKVLSHVGLLISCSIYAYHLYPTREWWIWAGITALVAVSALKRLS